MFYVIYNSATEQYRGYEGYGDYFEAVQYGSAADAEWDLDTTNTALKVIGPCIEGIEP